MRPNLWILVVERKIERYRVAFTANCKHQTQGDISSNQEINRHKLCKIIVMDQTNGHETTNFFVQIQQLNRLPTKTAQGWRSGEGTCLLSRVGGGYSPQRLLWGGSNRKGYLFMLQVYERVGLLLVLFLAERFFSGCSGFPLSPETNRSKFQIDLQRTDTFKRVLNNF